MQPILGKRDVFSTPILHDTLVMLIIVGSAIGWFATLAGERWGLALGGIAALIAGLIGLVNLHHAHSRAQDSVE